MIDKMYINYDRYIITIMIIIITTLTFKKMNIMILRGIKRNEYDDLKKKFKINNENRRQRFF